MRTREKVVSELIKYVMIYVILSFKIQIRISSIGAERGREGKEDPAEMRSSQTSVRDSPAYLTQKKSPFPSLLRQHV
jgi:hypothetical protein